MGVTIVSTSPGDGKTFPKVGNKVRMHFQSYLGDIQFDQEHSTSCLKEKIIASDTLFAYPVEDATSSESRFAVQWSVGEKETVRGWIITIADIEQSDKNRPIEWVVGENEAIRGWEAAIRRLSVGEKAKLFISRDYTKNNRQNLCIIPPGSPLVFDVEILSVGTRDGGVWSWTNAS